MSYSGLSGLVRAEPKTEIAGPSSASAPKPSTNSAWMRRTRQGSVCTHSLGPRESSSRWSVVDACIWLRRITTGPRCCSESGSARRWPPPPASGGVPSPRASLMRRTYRESVGPSGWSSYRTTSGQPHGLICSRQNRSWAIGIEPVLPMR